MLLPCSVSFYQISLSLILSDGRFENYLGKDSEEQPRFTIRPQTKSEKNKSGSCKNICNRSRKIVGKQSQTITKFSVRDSVLDLKFTKKSAHVKYIKGNLKQNLIKF